VVLYADGAGVEAATHDVENGWSSWPVEAGADGVGLSATADSDGTLHAAYYAGGAIHVATSKDGTSWQPSTVAQVGSGQNLDGRSTGVGIATDGTEYVTWYDPATDSVLLSSSKDGSTFTAVDLHGTTAHGEQPSIAIGAKDAVYVAWYDETEQDLLLGAYGDVGGLEFAIRSPTPSGAPTAAPSSTGGQCTTASNGALTVVASGVAFDTNCIQITAGEKVTIHFDNKDAGIQHNIAVFPSEQDLTTALFRGDLVTGPNTADYTVGPLKAGPFYFHCDVHPTINGTFKVVSGSGGGGGGGGGTSVTSKVTASGLAFDTSEIDLAANKPTTLTFDNQDSGVTHNIAIYKSSSDLTSPLFRGDAVTGPNSAPYKLPALKPGTYYFQCDYHPTTMNGTVTVK
jgi:plastocyanin